MARVIVGRYSVARNADSRLNEAHYRPVPFDVHFQSDRNRVYVAPSAARGMSYSRARTGLTNTTFSTGDLGAYADSYKSVVTKYAEAGGSLGAQVVATADKAMAVARDAAIGAGIGAAIPVLGELGIGEVGGALIAGIYSAFDNFGDDISAFFNPPDFNEGDYDRMKKNCLRSGGIPNWGHAPDNEDGCIYPDGTTSGGDYPHHPPPGVHSIRGDSFYDYDSVQGLCMGPNGQYVALPMGYTCAPGIGPVPPPAALRGPPPVIPISNARTLRITPTSKPIIPIANARRMLLKTPGTTPEAKAMVTVAAAMTGDPQATVDMRSTVDAARAGDALAITNARLMTHAQRLIMISTYVSHYLGGQGTAGMQRTGGCGCRGCA